MRREKTSDMNENGEKQNWRIRLTERFNSEISCTSHIQP